MTQINDTCKTVTSRSHEKIKELVLTGMMTSLICIMGPLSVPLPFSPVPISLTNLAIYFALYVLGMKRGCVSYLLYLLIGFAGLPVFSGFTAGPGKLLGPTGGYLAGFILMALIGGYVVDRWLFAQMRCFLGLAFGTVICYLFGTVWLAVMGGMSFPAALAAGVLPFIPGDICKIIIAVTAGPMIRRRLARERV